MMKRWIGFASQNLFASGGLSRFWRSILVFRARGLFLTDRVKPSLWQRLLIWQQFPIWKQNKTNKQTNKTKQNKKKKKKKNLPQN